MGNDLFFINVFPSNDRRQDFDYLATLKDMANTSTHLGVSNTLVTVGNKRLDPWILAQAGLHESKKFAPIIAVNPIYMHPMEVAKKIISLNRLFPNQVSLNLVTGSFFNEMKAVNDNLSLSERSLRLKEFYAVLSLLLQDGKVTFKGDFYHLTDAELFPKYQGAPLKIFISGTLSDVFSHEDHIFYVKSLRPISEMERATFINSGLAIGLCARPSQEEAITAVRNLYPQDRRGEMLFEISLNNNETPWNVWLKENISKHTDNFDFYLSPMQNYWASSPFIVDSYEGVAQKLMSYYDLGYKFFILDYHLEESFHIEKVLKLVRENRR